LLSIASVLESHGYRVLLWDVSAVREPLAMLSRGLSDLRACPLAVGISADTENAHTCAALQRLIREMAPGVKIILGGPHVTARYDEALLNPDTDVVVRGEGESTIIEVLEAIRFPAYGFEGIKGIAYRDGSGAIRCNSQRPTINALDQLPIAAYHQTDGPASRGVLNLISTRGCPGRCVFCAAHVVAGPLVRGHSAEWLFSMICALHRRNAFRVVSILDDTFTMDRRRVHTFCSLLRKWETTLVWMIRTRVDAIDEELVECLSSAGCIDVFLGIESADDGVLKSIGKNTNLAQIRQAIRLILKHGLLLETSFILGHHSDTRETIEKTILLAMAVREFGHLTGIGISTPFPGTPLDQRSRELGVRIAVHDWRRYNLHTPIYSTQDFTLLDLSKAEFLFRTRTFFDAPPTLLTESPHVHLRAELSDWIKEMRDIRSSAQVPALLRADAVRDFQALRSLTSERCVSLGGSRDGRRQTEEDEYGNT
jgi:radical SAM superfamily enzyme YgiQ (UPF0313 family)